MKSTLTAIIALALLSGSALAQTSPTDASDPIAKKFMSLDADKSGFLDGKELDTVKAKLAILDMDKDGKVSAQEFNMGVMTGVIEK